MKLPPTAAGSLATLVNKPGRKDKDTDVLMGAGFKYIKGGPKDGQMEAQFRGISNTSKLKRLFNALSGQRYLATENDIKNIFRNTGMNDQQIADAWRKVGNARHGGYLAADVKKQVAEFEKNDVQYVGAKIYITTESQLPSTDNTEKS